MSTKSNIGKIVAVAYMLGAGHATIEANRAINPLKQEFIQIVKSTPHNIEITETLDGDAKSLNYDGKLDQIVNKRKEYFKGKGCISTWNSYDGEPSTPLTICVNPFARFPKYK
jgi:hypothetical protein